MMFCIIWNLFIWSLIAALIVFKDWSAWTLLVAALMTAFPRDNGDDDDSGPLSPA